MFQAVSETSFLTYPMLDLRVSSCIATVFSMNEVSCLASMKSSLAASLSSSSHLTGHARGFDRPLFLTLT